MSTQRVSFELTAARLDEAGAWARGVLAGWGVRSSLAGAWSGAARAAVAQGPCRLDLELDGAAGLLSCEVVQDGRVVFGLDDWVQVSGGVPG